MTKESVDTINGACVLHTRVFDRTSQKDSVQVPLHDNI